MHRGKRGRSELIQKRIKSPVRSSARSVTQAACAAAFTLAKTSPQEDIKAKLEHGVLTLRIPKKEAKAKLP